MMSNLGPSIDWKTELRRAFARHGRKGLIFFILVFAAVALWTAFGPRTYRSEAKLYLRLGRENATLDPTATLGPSPIVAVPLSRDNEINSVVEILGSRALIEKVVDELTPRAIVGSDDRERAVRQLSKKLFVAAAKKSSVIDVAYRGGDPQLCQAVVAKLVEAYVSEHGRLNRTHGSREFFAAQTERLREELARRETELKNLKTATGLSSPAAQRQQIVARAGRLQDKLLETEAARDAAQARVVELREKLKTLPETQVAKDTSGFGNEGTDRMREQFYALQVREKEAQAKYSEDHPKMRQIREQVAAARKLLDQEERERRQVTLEPGLLHQKAQASLLAEEPLLAELAAQAQRLTTQLAAVRGELTKLNADELRLAAAQREVDLLEADYKKYAANLEQARIDQQLEVQRMSNISVVQAASYEPRPISPRVGLNLLLGLFVGGFGGLALPLALDQLDGRPTRDRSAAEIRRPNFPTLATIPRLKRRRTSLR